MKSILLVKKHLGLVEMTSGLVNASCKNDFLCTLGFVAMPLLSRDWKSGLLTNLQV